jgi:hypothetical protein
MNEVRHKIAATEADLAQAKAEGSIARRDRLEEYLLELQKEENRLSQAEGKHFVIPMMTGCSCNTCCFLPT